MANFQYLQSSWTHITCATNDQHSSSSRKGTSKHLCTSWCQTRWFSLFKSRDSCRPCTDEFSYADFQFLDFV